MSKWFDDIGAGLSKIGKGVRGAAGEVRKTVGIKVGSARIELAERHFHPGDTIRGTLLLELEEPTVATKLIVGLRGGRQKIGYEVDSSGGKSQTTHTETVHDFELELAGEQTYESAEFGFELVVPDDAKQAEPEITAGGVVGDVARVVAAVATAGRTTLSWSVYSLLDIPWKRGVRASTDIAVTRK